LLAAPPIEVDDLSSARESGRRALAKGAVVDLERYRKDAKALVRAFRDGDEEAVSRAVAVLGERAAQRFQLSDAQHVLAVEHGDRTWPELKRAAQAGAVSSVETELEYRPGEPVRLRVALHRFPWVFDDARAVKLAGYPGGWRAVAERIARERGVNVKRNGVLSLPVVAGGPGFDAIVDRVATTSLELYEELLELE
jgi:hypothetical protein